MMDILTLRALSIELSRATAAADDGEKVEINLPAPEIAGIFATAFYMGQVDDHPDNDIPKLDVSLVDITWPKSQDEVHYLPSEADCFKMNMADFFTAVETSGAWRERIKNDDADNRLNPEELAQFLEEVVNA